MKYILSLLLFCLIFQNIMTEKLSRKLQLAKFALSLRALAKANEQKSKLAEGTDITSIDDGESDTTVITNAPVTSYTPTPDDQPESANATAENAPVNSNKPVSLTRKETSDKKAKVQVTKFHGFNAIGLDIIFKTLMYFLETPVAERLYLRLRIDYATTRLRGLQAATAESARTDCVIEEKYKDFVGKILPGQHVNYNCNATASKDTKNANFTLNTDIPLSMVNANGTIETVNFDEVNFNGDTAEAANSLQLSNKDFSGAIVTIKDSIAFFEGYILKVVGTYRNLRRLRNLQLGEIGDIDMNILSKNNETKKYTCRIKGTTNGEDSELSCNTAGDPITTNSEKLHFSSGNSSDTLVSIEMRNGGNTTTDIVPTGGSNRYYSKSSSGLSGGAIAGIVIACVVVLAAASIAAIMLRKPTPPIDNTTVVNLKSENI